MSGDGAATYASSSAWAASGRSCSSVRTSALESLNSEGLVRPASSPGCRPEAVDVATSQSGCSAVTTFTALDRVRSARNSALPVMSRILPNAEATPTV